MGEWCERRQYFYNEFVDSGDPHHRFDPDDRNGYVRSYSGHSMESIWFSPSSPPSSPLSSLLHPSLLFSLLLPCPLSSIHLRRHPPFLPAPSALPLLRTLMLLSPSGGSNTLNFHTYGSMAAGCLRSNTEISVEDQATPATSSRLAQIRRHFPR